MHFVYGLTHPITETVTYIGVTNNLPRRYQQHCSPKSGDNGNHAMWIRSLKERGWLPGLKVIEVVDDSRHREREKYWIGYYSDRGFRLTNIYHVPLEGISDSPAMTSSREQFGDLLTAVMERRKQEERYSLRRLSQEIHVDYAHVNRVFHSQSLPSREVLLKICKGLKCTQQEYAEIFAATEYRSPTSNEIEEEQPAA